MEQFFIIFKSEKIVLHNDDYKFMAQFRDTVRANFTQEILFNKVQWGKILANYFSKYFIKLKKNNSTFKLLYNIQPCTVYCILANSSNYPNVI